MTMGSAFEVLVDKTLTAPDRGGTREIPFKEALQLRTFQDAVAGKATAMRAAQNPQANPSVHLA